MLAHELRPPKGSKRARKRIGRGNASGHGTYSGKGLKGQKSRTGRKPGVGFEGGQTRLIKRLPRRRGFTNIFRVEYSAVNLRDLERFDAGTEVTPELLKRSRVVSTLRRPIKVLALGDLTKALTVRAHKFSATAKEKIEKAGGSAQAIVAEDAAAKETARPKRRAAAEASARSAAAEETAAEGTAAEATAAEGTDGNGG
jgi:large subunit ribosomal protein L15